LTICLGRFGHSAAQFHTLVQRTKGDGKGSLHPVELAGIHVGCSETMTDMAGVMGRRIHYRFLHGTAASRAGQRAWPIQFEIL
jgi:hypothetical protein